MALPGMKQMPCMSRNFTISSCTVYNTNSIPDWQVGATYRTAIYFIRLMSATHTTLLGNAITPQMVAPGVAATVTTMPIPIFSGSFFTSFEGAAIHHDV